MPFAGVGDRAVSLFLDPSYCDLGQFRPPTLKVRTRRSLVSHCRLLALAMV